MAFTGVGDFDDEEKGPGGSLQLSPRDEKGGVEGFEKVGNVVGDGISIVVHGIGNLHHVIGRVDENRMGGGTYPLIRERRMGVKRRNKKVKRGKTIELVSKES